MGTEESLSKETSSGVWCRGLPGRDTKEEVVQTSVQRHEGREGRVISQTGNQKGSLRTISCAWTLSVNGGKPGEVSKLESGMSVYSMGNG